MTYVPYDKLVFNKIKARLGGNVRVMLTASAPIAGNVLNFLKVKDLNNNIRLHSVVLLLKLTDKLNIVVHR